jgi:F0F1-type ATP synthase delta subunit
MKISPKIYAKSLIESAQDNNLKNIATKFWYILQKNKQYKDLTKVMDAIDEQAAEKENKVLVKIYAKESPSEAELQILTEKIEKKLGKKIITKILSSNITGYLIKADDKIIDLSLENKVNRLKKILTD